jgi:hypothetical protein
LPLRAASSTVVEAEGRRHEVRVAKAERDFWTAAPYLAVAAVCAAGAFVGLSASSYSIDELFSLFVVDHRLGFGEVLSRALTDTHPPGYYFLLHPWIVAFGSSETSTRAFSALTAVAALPVLFLALRGTLGLPARAFAVALAAASHLFILATQTMRSYALCVLLAAALLGLTLALHRRLTAGRGLPVGLLAGLWLTSLVAEYVHFYLFLVVGMVHLHLLLAARRWRERAVVVASGLTLAALMGVYVVVLLQQTRQDLQHMWFSNSWSDLGRQAWAAVAETWGGTAFAAILLLALAPWADRLRGVAASRPPPPDPALPGLCLLTIFGVVISGLAVSFLIAPSFGTRNLFALGPFFWALAAWMFEAQAPDLSRLSGRLFAGLLVVLVALSALPARARLVPQAEEWRASAALAAAEPGCEGQILPVVLPYIFGPSTPFFRQLAEQRFFGRYFPEPGRLRAYTPDEFAPATADPALAALLRARARSGCPLLAWGVHDLDSYAVLKLRRDIAETAGVPSAQVRVRVVPNRKVGMFGNHRPKEQAFLFERADGPT